ncbi:hypothetical protein BDV96DRAFT_184254 [Lophiotrema nucula]|uniref:Ricin B lectin domain-containing protein n=1 Tax=Lophiotrema nucula TaxID=690887 RepID=A0A6A5YZH5_9PLEO|nr:hypothetical protein BDV96DRAFT_184254 [Lophiotrema nucula]
MQKQIWAARDWGRVRSYLSHEVDLNTSHDGLPLRAFAASRYIARLTMGTLDLSSKYILTNAYTLSSKQLASNGDQIFMDGVGNTDSHQWYLTSTTLSSYYRLHTVANGDTESLDVLNDNGTSSTSLQFYQTGSYQGQYWRLDDWGDGTFRLSNEYTGLDMHLDTYSGTLEPFLGDGDHTGQHWSFSRVGGASSSSSSSVSSTATSTSVSNAFSTSYTSQAAVASSSTPAVASNSHSSSLPIGAIVGIAIGGVLALVLCVCAVVFFLRSRRASSRSTAVENAGNPPSYYAAQEKGVNAGGYHAPAELVGGEVHSPVELAGQRY